MNLNQGLHRRKHLINHRVHAAAHYNTGTITGSLLYGGSDRGVCCGVNKQLAELAGGASMNVSPAEACFSDTLLGIFNGIP